MTTRRYFTVDTVRALEHDLQHCISGTAGRISGTTGQWVELKSLPGATPAVHMPTSEVGREALRNFTVDFDVVNHAFSQAVRRA